MCAGRVLNVQANNGKVRCIMKLQRWNWRALGLPGPVKVRDANGKQHDPHRIDWRRGYCPDNCRWATHKEQNKNRHLTDRFRESARRNLEIAREARRRKRLGI